MKNGSVEQCPQKAQSRGVGKTKARIVEAGLVLLDLMDTSQNTITIDPTILNAAEDFQCPVRQLTQDTFGCVLDQPRGGVTPKGSPL